MYPSSLSFPKSSSWKRSNPHASSFSSLIATRQKALRDNLLTRHENLILRNNSQLLAQKLHEFELNSFGLGNSESKEATQLNSHRHHSHSRNPIEKSPYSTGKNPASSLALVKSTTSTSFSKRASNSNSKPAGLSKRKKQDLLINPSNLHTMAGSIGGELVVKRKSLRQSGQFPNSNSLNLQKDKIPSSVPIRQPLAPLASSNSISINSSSFEPKKSKITKKHRKKSISQVLSQGQSSTVVAPESTEINNIMMLSNSPSTTKGNKSMDSFQNPASTKKIKINHGKNSKVVRAKSISSSSADISLLANSNYELIKNSILTRGKIVTGIENNNNNNSHNSKSKSKLNRAEKKFGVLAKHNKKECALNSTLKSSTGPDSNYNSDQNSSQNQSYSEQNTQNINNNNDSKNSSASSSPKYKASVTIKQENSDETSNKTLNSSTPSPTLPRKGILKQPKTPTYPVLANLKLCNAQPGTKEWTDYWDQYDKAMADYKKSEVKYLEDNSAYREDIEKYRREAAHLAEMDTMFRQSIGLEQKKTNEILGHQLTGLTTVNGFVFDRSGGVNGLTAYLSTVGSKGFRLEVEIPQDCDRESIVIDSEFNMMKIQVPVDKEKSSYKTIVIGVPSEHKMKDLEVFRNFVNGWIIVEMSPDRVHQNQGQNHNQPSFIADTSMSLI